MEGGTQEVFNHPYLQWYRSNRLTRRPLTGTLTHLGVRSLSQQRTEAISLSFHDGATWRNAPYPWHWYLDPKVTIGEQSEGTEIPAAKGCSDDHCHSRDNAASWENRRVKVRRFTFIHKRTDSLVRRKREYSCFPGLLPSSACFNDVKIGFWKSYERHVRLVAALNLSALRAF